MVTINSVVEFILNSETVRAYVPPGMLALDYLRRDKNMTGTKSGCKEGDCGACSVIIGELDNNKVTYRPMTSCLLPMGELHGKHLVTIEGLNMEKLSPIQNAMVNCGGTQCGYCTPGFVVCMTAGLMAPQVPLDSKGVLYAISGNLCRCTGYGSIRDAGKEAVNAVRDQLKDKERIRALVDAKALPEYFLDITDRLLKIPTYNTDNTQDPKRMRTLVAGGTDLYVQRREKLIDEPITLLNTGKPIASAYISDDKLVLDPRITFESFSTDPLVSSILKGIHKYNLLMASWPIRTRSTLGGNLCNASPIADMTCLLMALESNITLTNHNGENRVIPLNEFYLGYKKLNKSSDEIVTKISFPVVKENTHISWEKVSKRAWLDIATVNVSSKITINDGYFSAASIAIGGVAAIPLYLAKSSEYLINKPFTVDSIINCLKISQSEFNPIGDIRGSALYKRMLARQLLLANFVNISSESLDINELYEAL